MAKKVVGFIKLQIPGGQANPAPPVGPALGQHQVNIMQFCQAFNAATQDKIGHDHPGRDHGLRGPLVHVHPEDAAGGRAAQAGRGHRDGLGRRRTATRSRRSRATRCAQIAETKMPDLNANDVEAAMKIIDGTARSMGIDDVD